MDVQAAKRAGGISVAVDWGIGIPEELRAQNPDKIISRFEQVAQLFE